MSRELNDKWMSLLARTVIDPAYTPSQATLVALRISPNCIPYSQLRLFAASVLRIKHSFLWEMAPLSMTFLRMRSIVLPVFIDYAPSMPLLTLSQYGALDRSLLFLQYLAHSRLHLRVRKAYGVSGIAKHELIKLSQTRRQVTRSTSSDKAGSQIALHPTVDVLGYSADPRSGVGAIEKSISRSETLLLYKDGDAIDISNQLDRAVILAATRRTSRAAFLKKHKQYSAAASTLSRHLKQSHIQLI